MYLKESVIFSQMSHFGETTGHSESMSIDSECTTNPSPSSSHNSQSMDCELCRDEVVHFHTTCMSCRSTIIVYDGMFYESVKLFLQNKSRDSYAINRYPFSIKKSDDKWYSFCNRSCKLKSDHWFHSTGEEWDESYSKGRKL